MTFKPARLLLALIASPAVPRRIRPEPRRRQRQGHPVLARRRSGQAGRGPGPAPDSPQLREMIKKDLIAREVMMQEASSKATTRTPEVKQALDNARQTIVINALARDYVTKNPVTDADIKAEYDRFTKQTGDKEYHVRHILVAPKPTPRPSSPSSRAAPSSKTWPSSRRTPAPPTTAATSTGPARRPSRKSSRRLHQACKKARSPRPRSRPRNGFHVIKWTTSVRPNCRPWTK
jgi:hypothetical protein